MSSVRKVYLGYAGEDATPRATGTKTAAYNAQFGDIVVVDSTAGPITVNLPDCDKVGMISVQMRAGANAVTIDGYNSQTVDGAATIQLTAVSQTVLLAGDGLGAWTSVAGGGLLAGLDGTYDRVASNVNTVATSGATQTIPEPSVSSFNDITLTANCTLTLPATTKGKHLHFVFRQDATGSRTVTWPAGTKFPGGSLTITATANAVDYVEAISMVAGTWIVYRSGAAIA